METAQKGRVRVEPSAKRVRVYFGGTKLADTTGALLVWEVPYYPTYYLPLADVRQDALKADGGTRHSPSRGDATLYTVTAGGRSEAEAALVYPDSPVLKDYVRFEWKLMDGWFEEDEEVFTHARDPYTRVDILHSSRHVRVEVDGETVADSRNATLLFETGLPTRYYLPKTDIRQDALTHTDTETHCPYKGQAEYWSVNGHADLAWSYRTPLPESQKITGLVAFYNEKVDIYVDDVLQERPRSRF
ncbi:DUF427 domain-containing protein [Nonomuraea sp. NPDC050556]|uniref:DUF427 domain-containing protein n=1 Tax=Nonomuraea sp. NPDC050556 TaxID=3364369 RepID=UPI0037B46F51